MKSLIRLLLLMLPLAAAAQSQLPPCPAGTNNHRHDCFGTFTFANGDKYVGEYKNGIFANGQGTFTFANGNKYVGEFKDDKRNGQGIEYRADGTINRSGRWVNGDLAQSFAIDRSRFPFDRLSQAAVPPVDPSRAERDRLAAEAEAAKRRQQELEQRLALERQPLVAAAQSQLPPCPAGAGQHRHDCFGTFTFANGDKYVGEYKNGIFANGQGTFTFANGNKYVGEFKDDKRNGQGIEYRADGTINRSGRWVNGDLAQSFAIDRSRFPFDRLSQAAVPPVDPSRAERDRLAAEAEAAKRRQQELEQRLATEARERERQAAEADAARLRQKELEQRLALEAREREKQTAEAEASKRRQQELEQRLALERQLQMQAAEADAARLRQKELEQRLATDAREREKQAAEAEAARSKQQELEQRLATEAREREKQAAEAEAARSKQQELEQRLATEAREREKQAAEVEAVRRRQQELEAQLAALQSQAASRPPNQVASSRNQRRVALVIGNAQYKVSPLENPVNDATDIDRTLKQLGFQTTLLRNATLGQMREATRRFADQLQSADVALIYFAGHGVESNRKNYMIPVNADLKFEYELDDQAYNAGQWLDMLESIKSSNAERVNIVILDACRNNSLIGARSLGRGLGRMDAPTGTFLAYSTAPGKVAADGARGERNSPFTRHLLTVMQQPGLPIEEAFKEVRRNVSRETNGAQVPWESTSLTGFFTFRQTR